MTALSTLPNIVCLPALEWIEHWNDLGFVESSSEIIDVGGFGLAYAESHQVYLNRYVCPKTSRRIDAIHVVSDGIIQSVQRGTAFDYEASAVIHNDFRTTYYALMFPHGEYNINQQKLSKLLFYTASLVVAILPDIMQRRKDLELNKLEKLTENQKRRIDNMKSQMLRLNRKLFKLKNKCAELKQKAHPKTRDTSGYVYVLQEINGVHYKIGRTRNPKNRLRTFNVKLPFKVEIDILLKTDDMYTLERALHERFADKRVNGEWFALEDTDLDFIHSLAKGEN